MSPTVLLIDYDPRSVARIEGLLSGFGVRVVVAKDGVAGMIEFVRHRPDLTLIQDLIPRTHGFELCKALKATDHGKAFPILLLATLRPGKRGALRTTGCDDWVAKPFDDATLVDKVRRYLPVPAPLPVLQELTEAQALNADIPESPDPATVPQEQEEPAAPTAAPLVASDDAPLDDRDQTEIEIEFADTDECAGVGASETPSKSRRRRRKSRARSDGDRSIAIL